MINASFREYALCIIFTKLELFENYWTGFRNSSNKKKEEWRAFHAWNRCPIVFHFLPPCMIGPISSSMNFESYMICFGRLGSGGIRGGDDLLSSSLTAIRTFPNWLEPSNFSPVPQNISATFYTKDFRGWPTVNKAGMDTFISSCGCVASSFSFRISYCVNLQ